MFHSKKTLFGAALAAATFAGALAQASAADVSTSTHVRPRPAVWYGPPGRCASYYYPHYRAYGTPWHDCGFPVWYGTLYIDGNWRHGPFYYQVRHGERFYWWHGAWRRSEWRGFPR
jgi:hypothetical protein